MHSRYHTNFFKPYLDNTIQLRDNTIGTLYSLLKVHYLELHVILILITDISSGLLTPMFG